MQHSYSDSVGQATRLKRLILIGTFASFLSFFGLTVAFDYQTQHTEQVQQQSNIASFQPLSNDDDNGGGFAAAPQIRTRTS